MSSLITIRIVPQKPTDPLSFSDALAAGGGLRITVANLAFATVDAAPSGVASVTVPLVTAIPAGGWSVSDGALFPKGAVIALTLPPYPSGLTGGIVQQVNFVPSPAPAIDPDPVAMLQAVATAVIELPWSVSQFENIRVSLDRGVGPFVAVGDYYVLPPDGGPVPDLSAWTPSGIEDEADPWAQRAADLYLALPPVPPANPAAAFHMPTDGTAPPFDTLLGAVKAILAEDPSPAATVLPLAAAGAPAGATILAFAAPPTGVVPGMAATGAGLPPGARVAAIAGATVTLDTELEASLAGGASVTFTPTLAGLTVNQCRNIARELLWSQQPALPQPPDPIEALYTNPPNDGALLTGGTSVNQIEGDRQQFEATLKSYYAAPNAVADRLATCVYALSAAVACEEASVAATAAIVRFPAQPEVTGGGGDQTVILTALGHLSGPARFGVPAAFFYALAGTTPTSRGPAARYASAVGAPPTQVLSQLTAAIDNGTIGDGEAFATAGLAGQVTAAQAARRLSALGIPRGAVIAPAPLGSRTGTTTAPTASGTALPLASTAGLAAGFSIDGTGLPPIATVTSVNGATGVVGLSSPLLNAVPAGTRLTLAPPWPAQLEALVTDWLAFPPAVSGTVSSRTYQPGDDDTLFWQAQADTHPAAFLELILCALSGGYIIPAPFSQPLGARILDFLTTLDPAPTARTLAGVTEAQWTALFKANPTWLPPQPGGIGAAIGVFLESVRGLFPLSAGGPASLVNLATALAAPAGATTLAFATTTGLQTGWTVASTLTTPSGQPVIPPGTRIAAVSPAPAVVTLTTVLTGAVPAGTNISFRPTVPAALSSGLPVFAAPPDDWIAACLKAFDPAFLFGQGIADPAKLDAAAATRFPDDGEARSWLVEAIVTIDALAALAVAAGFPVTGPSGPAPLAGAEGMSIVEALYACGFRRAADISALSADDFSFALTGTVAFTAAGALHGAAMTIAPPSTENVPPEAGFHAVNPDGSLVDCLPPPQLSPLGPVAYLQALLALPLGATCEAPAPAGPTLGDAVTPRRGPLSSLAASRPNLETPLPLIDLANECLEYLGAAATPEGGTVYDTTGDTLAGFVLCGDDDGAEKTDPENCHPPAFLFAALPEHASPATPTTATQLIRPAVYDRLKTDFSTPALPYNQALDVNRTLLRHLGSCRFETMRSFRRCITEFVLDPEAEPAGFDDQVWRYPVRLDIAIDYLGITPEEYALLFHGAPFRPCGRNRDQGTGGTNDPTGDRNEEPGNGETGAAAGVHLSSSLSDRGPISLPVLMSSLGLGYCDLVLLQHSGIVPFGCLTQGGDGNQGNGETGETRIGLAALPACEPCCPERVIIGFPRDLPPRTGLARLEIFVRLWRILGDRGCACYSFAELADIASVLGLFTATGTDPDFIRQLAAFQMLRDDFHLPLGEPDPPKGVSGVARSPLLALWASPRPPQFAWAVRALVTGVARHARRHYGAPRRGPDYPDRMVSELDALALLAGFAPAPSPDAWEARPTHTLRFAEFLGKLYASPFRLTEVRYLFTTVPLPPDGLPPFPMQDPHEASRHPFDLPDGQHEVSLHHLRRHLLDAVIDPGDARDWDWRKIAFELESALGFAEADIRDLGFHFFPHVLERAGCHVPAAGRRFTSPLAPADTTPAVWDSPPDGPFQYDAGDGLLWTRVPLSDEALLRRLYGDHDFNAPERTAIQDLYFQPRALLARFQILFPDLNTAIRVMVEAGDQEERWLFFRLCVMACLNRRRIIIHHLTRHVREITGTEEPGDASVAALLLNRIAADENLLAPTASDPSPTWEDPSGSHAALTWPGPGGSALQALLALTGTGLVADYAPDGGAVLWRDASGSLAGFGAVRDHANCPVPTVLPALDATVSASQSAFVTARNGLLLANGSNRHLGGAEGVTVTWTGVLLIDEEGEYHFWAGAPRPCEEKPEWDAPAGALWSVVLARGGKSWTLSSRGWSGQEDRRFACLPLRRGAYDLSLTFRQPGPDFVSSSDARPAHTGFEVKYAGPDSDGIRIAIPHHRLFQDRKDAPLGTGLPPLAAGAADYLSQRYVSSIRDIRRTYQRVFKALLLAHRFGLRAADRPDEPSELGYLLSRPDRFAGTGFLRSGAGFVARPAEFDLNYLPVTDVYLPPAADQRAAPSAPRVQAMADWWERLFDVRVLKAAAPEPRHLWRLFQQAADLKPSDPAPLLQGIGAPPFQWPFDLRFHQRDGIPPYAVTALDLTDERWTIRAWRADRWLSAMRRHFAATTLSAIRPDLWAADNPAAVLGSPSGNGNCLAFLTESCFAANRPHRHEPVRRLVNGLRHRARAALTAWLCAGNRVPLPWGGYATRAADLADLLLIDLEAGPDQRASRIEEAISAIQTFVRRARLGLEPGWTVPAGFIRLWDSRYASYQIWRRARVRDLYPENGLEWTDLPGARRSPAFRMLEETLRDGALSLAAPGGDIWWPNAIGAGHRSPPLAERRTAMDLTRLNPAREGLGLMATPDVAAAPSWTAPIPFKSPQPQSSDTAPAAAPPSGDRPFPLWMRAAIGLGVRFLRIAAAGPSPASARLAPPRAEERHPPCCPVCGDRHEATVDETWFWLTGGRFFDNAPLPDGIQPGEGDDGYQSGYQDDFYDAGQQQSAYWQDETQLPHLLAWSSKPMVRLAWARVHNGRILQPRRSSLGVAVDPDGPVDLVLTGRTADSLFFSVTGGISPAGFADPSPAGFRYDLATDGAVPLPRPTLPAPVTPAPGGLPAYPWFVYAPPGAPAFPLSRFSPALAVAGWLRAHCRFEDALDWVRLAFDPVTSDCTWIRCAGRDRPLSTATGEIARSSGSDTSGACCDSTRVPLARARQRTLLLAYLETMLDWGDALMRRRRSPEAFQQARTLFAAARRLLGPAPVGIRMPAPGASPTVGAFAAAAAPLNPRLMELYSRLADRTTLIHAGSDSARLTDAGLDGRGRDDAGPYFGERPARAADGGPGNGCHDDEGWCRSASPYRFTFLIQKALEYSARAQEMSGAMLAAFEKGDAEALAAVRALHERELMALGLDGRKDQWREADWQIKALQKTKAVNQANLAYYNGLVSVNLIGGELQYQDNVNASLALRSVANAVEAVGEGLRLIPDFVVGAAGFGGTPVAISWLPLGTKLGDMFAAIARIMNNSAQIDSETAGLDLTEAGWTRRYAEWCHQQQILAIEIQQMERQILGAQRRRDQMLRELNLHQRQIEHAAEIDDILRDKVTGIDLYLFLQERLAALYYQTFDLALDTARQAERAFNLERGHLDRRFVADIGWEDLRRGLGAAEQLAASVRRMEKAYFDENVREYELTRHISLRQSFPFAFLQLRATGRCDFEIPEWMFDQDYPGHFMRRIRNVSLTLPCVAGPYTGVHAHLTLIGSDTRVDPRLEAPAHLCCAPQARPSCGCGCGCGSDCGCGSAAADGYRMCPDDPRGVRLWGEREAIATSGGQNDSGLFELSFNDPRYLPFEFMGAISRWRLELPVETNYFDPATLSDMVLHLNYTSREGGPALREAALAAGRDRLPGDGWTFFDVRHDFAEAWELFRRAAGDGCDDRPRPLTLSLRRRLFPYLPKDPPIRVTRLVLCVLPATDPAPPCPEVEGCPCPRDLPAARHMVGLVHPAADCDGVAETAIPCFRDAARDGLLIGASDIHLAPFYGDREERPLAFLFPGDWGAIEQVYLLCRFEAVRGCHQDSLPHPPLREGRMDPAGDNGIGE